MLNIWSDLHERISVTAMQDTATRICRKAWRAGEAEIAAVDNFDVVVGKSDGGEGEGGKDSDPHEGIAESAHSRVGTTMEMTISTPPMVGVPAFFCGPGALFADVLADLEFAQLQ